MGEWGIGDSHFPSITPINSKQSGTHQKKVYIFEIYDNMNFLCSIFYNLSNAKSPKSSADIFFSAGVSPWM